MPGNPRNKRQPISCEPCRLRKIRCARDGQPCTTCVRRNVDCRYVRPPSSSRGIVSSSSTTLFRGDDNARDALVQRVRRLEQLLLDDEQRELDLSTTPPPISRDNQPEHTQRHPREFCGTLKTDAEGFVRYTPSSNQWQSSRLAMADTATSGVVTRVPFSEERALAEHVFASLPSRDHCAALVRVYFESYASLFHVLHDPTFLQQYQSFEKDARTMPLTWMALLYAILGTAVHALQHDSPLLRISHKQQTSEQIEDLSSRYRQRAMRCLELDSYLWKHNVVTLQALIILIYSINHSHGQTWSLLGTAHHIATSIGCHVDPSHFELDAIRCEERRRCWAALKMLYTQQNTALGHLGTGHARFPSDCRMPSDVDDEALDIDVCSSGVVSSRDPPTQMSYLLLKFRLYDICTDICESVLSRPQIETRQVDRLQKELDREQQSWRDKYSLGRRPLSDLAPHHLAHIQILQSYVSHLTLLLHQSVILRAGDYTADDAFWSSCDYCLKASKVVFKAHEQLYSDKMLAPFSWYVRGMGSFQAFHAAVVVLMLSQRAEGIVDTRFVADMIQDCAERFSDMAELSPFCANAVTLLRQISTRAKGKRGQLLDDDIVRAGSHQHEQENTGVQALQTPSSLTSNTFAWPKPNAHSHQQHNAVSQTDDFSNLYALFEDIQPQQWLSPAAFPPLDQWLITVDAVI